MKNYIGIICSSLIIFTLLWVAYAQEISDIHKTEKRITEYQTIGGGYDGKEIYNYSTSYIGGKISFDLAINKLIKQGWQPLGGVAVSQGYIYQTMVKYQ